MRTIPTRNYSHLGDIGGQERATEPPSDMGISGQKGPPPATVLDPLRTWHAPYPYHKKLDVEHIPWVAWIHMNHSNQKFKPLG